MQINFQAGVEDIYDACVAKGSTPASTSLSDVIDGIMAIPTGITPSGTLSITANGTGIDVSQYASVDVAVPNSNSATYTYASGSTGGTVDMGVANTYRYVNASNVYAKGKADGDVKHTVKVELIPSSSTLLNIYKDSKIIGSYVNLNGSGASVSYTI